MFFFLHYLTTNVYCCIYLTGSRNYVDVAVPCTVRRACSSILPRGFLAIQMYMPVSFSWEATILKDNTQQTEVRLPNQTRAISTMKTTVIIHISIYQNESQIMISEIHAIYMLSKFPLFLDYRNIWILLCHYHSNGSNTELPCQSKTDCVTQFFTCLILEPLCN